MNGFELMANSYRKLIKTGEVSESKVKRDIEIYDFLATCDQSDMCRLVDSSAFNDYIKAYSKKAMSNAGMDSETIHNVLDELKWLFDTVSAEEILNQI